MFEAETEGMTIEILREKTGIPSLVSFREYDYGYLLENNRGTRWLCNKDFKISEGFDGNYSTISRRVFLLKNKNGYRCVCRRDTMECSIWFDGGWKLDDAKDIVYWNAPLERVFKVM